MRTSVQIAVSIALLLGLGLSKSAPAAPEPPGLLISEVCFWPREDKPEWVELKNYGEQPVNASRLVLTAQDSTVVALPAQLPPVPPGGFVLVLFEAPAGDSSDEEPKKDDLSFQGDNLAVIHIDVAPDGDVFKDVGGSCSLYTDTALSPETIADYVFWGNLNTRPGESPDAVKAEIWKPLYVVKTATRGSVTGASISIHRGGSITRQKILSKYFTRAWYVSQSLKDTTPGSENALPSPVPLRPKGGDLSRHSPSFPFLWLTRLSDSSQLQISRHPNFETLEYDLITGKGGRALKNVPPGRYYWRARSFLGERVSAWTETHTFIVR